METEKKRLIMRAEHRGMKEMDIILGKFVRANINDWSLEQVQEVEKLLQENDQKLYAMICGHEPIDPNFNDLLTEIKDFVNQA